MIECDQCGHNSFLINNITNYKCYVCGKEKIIDVNREFRRDAMNKKLEEVDNELHKWIREYKKIRDEIDDFNKEEKNITEN